MREAGLHHTYIAHIPWFFELYKSVKIFTGQGVERNNDMARSVILRKSNKWDSACFEPCNFMQETRNGRNLIWREIMSARGLS